MVPTQVCKWLILAIFLITTSLAHAQIKRPGFMLGFNGQYAMPSGDFANAYTYGVGGEAFAGIGLGKTFIVGSAGYSIFKGAMEGNGDITYTPIKGGVRQYLFGRHVFVNGDIGVGKVKSGNISTSRFIRGIGAGVRLLGIEGSIYYDGWKNEGSNGFSNSIVVKVGTSFVL